MSASSYTEMITNEADTAGFFVAGLGSPGVHTPFAPGTLVSPWGIPVYVDSGLAADDLLVADWKAFTVYLGDDFRVDTSEEAGERWDKNLADSEARPSWALMPDPASTPGRCKSWRTSFS